MSVDWPGRGWQRAAAVALATLLFGGMLAGPVAAQQKLGLPDIEEMDPVPTTSVTGQSLDWPDETEARPASVAGADPSGRSPRWWNCPPRSASTPCRCRSSVRRQPTPSASTAS